MKKLLSVGFIACLPIALLLTGCACLYNPSKLEPVTFNHPDEIIQGTGPTEGYCVLADRRVFAVMAFLNAVGYDDEAPGRKMHPLRLKLRQQLADNLAPYPDKLQAWKKYYHRHRLGYWQYANWSLTLCSDYPFRRVRPNKELEYPWTAWKLAGFPEILNDFWQTAKLEAVWADCRPGYLAELNRYSPQRIAREMNALWAYLRMPRSDTYTIIQVPNPIQRHASASANTITPYFYSIDGPNSNGGGLNTHEYLHTFINGLMKASYPAQKKKLRRYFQAGKDAPISSTYQDPLDWSTECLVHALAHRVEVLSLTDPSRKAMTEADVTALTRAGYPLLQPLYQQLTAFEKSNFPFHQYLPILLKELPEYQK